MKDEQTRGGRVNSDVRPRRLQRESMRASSFMARAALLALLTFAAIAIHEIGHFLVYWGAGIPVRITLQSVHAAEPVPAALDHWALAAGPVLSVVAAAAFLLAARARPGFFWASAAFTNASLRLFPMAFDIVRALKGGRPFSDEGSIALAWTPAPLGRALLLSVPAIVYLALTALAARSYRFATRPLLRILGVYVYTVAIGICVVLVDELLHQ